MRRYFAEGLGTFVLVLGGVGTAVIAGPVVGTLGVALAFGLSLLVMVYVIGPISGCHVNPAVTLGAFLAGKIRSRDVIPYVIAQCAGAILAAGSVYLMADGRPLGYNLDVNRLGANGYGLHSPAGYGVGAAFFAEAVLTGLLVTAVLGATDVRAPVGFAGIAIGFTLAAAHLVSIPITNTSVNPARSLGPAVWVQSWALSQLWLFIAAPFAGAIAAALLYRALRPSAEPLSTPREAAPALPSESLARVLEEIKRMEASQGELTDYAPDEARSDSDSDSGSGSEAEPTRGRAGHRRS